MSKFAIIGYPSRHSLSPTLFSAAYPNSVDTYDFIEAPTIEEAMSTFDEQEYKGANITSPFKRDIIRFCDHIDDIALRAEAVNLIVRQNGEIYGYNSDYIGVRSIAENLLDKKSIGANAIVTGAGGAGRAAALALSDIGFAVTILNRTVENARIFAEKHKLSHDALSESKTLLTPGTLLVHAIDYELPSHSEIDLSKTIVIEANYKRPNLSTAGCNLYISGKEWLIFQAIPAFKILTGFLPDIEAIKKIGE